MREKYVIDSTIKLSMCTSLKIVRETAGACSVR